jgi:hypothetical protein
MYRYEVGFQDTDECKGWIDSHCQRMAEAFKIVEKLIRDNPGSTIYIFDKMAHKNRVNLWTFKKGEIKSRIERRHK